MPTPNLAQTIRARRTDLGLTQIELARKARVDQTAISKWETGKSLPTLPFAFRIAEALELPITDLIEAAR